MQANIDAKILRKIKDGAFRRLSVKSRTTTNLYILEEVLKEKSRIMAGHQEINIEKPTLMVFVDDEPLANWSHDCRYLLHDVENGELYKEVKAGFPPFLVEPPETFKAFHNPVVTHNPLRKLWAVEKEIMFPWRFRKGTRYAILFSGASNNRHTNDLEFLYRQLTDRFFFDEDKITVLNYDGTINYSGMPKPVTAWPGDGTSYAMPVHGPGTKDAFNNAIDAIKIKLQPDDLLLIHTNNHGGHNGTESYICTYSGVSIKASDFANKLKELPVFDDLVVMMEQCHSGGFNDVIIEASTARRTTFACACSEGKNSIGGPDFDPFARDWIASLAGADPYGASLVSDPDYDANGRISAREAFAYADYVHDVYDSPVYTAFGADAGEQHLQQRWKYLFMFRQYVTMELKRLYDKLADPYVYRREMRTKIIPALAVLDDEMAVKPLKPEEAQQKISEIIRLAAVEKDKRERMDEATY